MAPFDIETWEAEGALSKSNGTVVLQIETNDTKTPGTDQKSAPEVTNTKISTQYQYQYFWESS